MIPDGFNRDSYLEQPLQGRRRWSTNKKNTSFEHDAHLAVPVPVKPVETNQISVYMVNERVGVRLTRGVARNQFPLLTVDDYMLVAGPDSELRFGVRRLTFEQSPRKEPSDEEYTRLFFIFRPEIGRDRFTHRCTMNVTMAVNATVNCSIHVSVYSNTENIMLTPIPLHRPHMPSSQRKGPGPGRVKEESSPRDEVDHFRVAIVQNERVP